MFIQYRKCFCTILFLLIALGTSNSWAGEIKGKVDIVLRDTLFIKLDSNIVPNVGDKVDVKDSSSVSIGTWQVSKIKKNSVIAKKVEGDGEAVSGMDVVIFSKNAPDASSIQAEVSVETPTPVVTTRREVPVQTTRHVQTVQQQSHGGSLGVNIQDIAPDLRKFFNIPSETQGVLVQSVIEGSAAQKAGLESGDVITEFNGESLGDSSSLVSMVSALPPGTKVNLKIVRKGWGKDLNVVLDGGSNVSVSSNTNVLSEGNVPQNTEVSAQAEEYYKKGEKFANNKQYGEGLYWFKKATDLNHAKAQNYLGLMYMNGWSVAQDYSIAVELFTKAVNNGNKFGNFNLARLYENGWGVRKDKQLAEEYYRKSGDYIAEYKRGARRGNKDAQAWLRKRRIKWEEPKPPTAVLPTQNYSSSPPRNVPVAPQRGGYNNQMQQERGQKNREAAGKLLVDLLKIRNQAIESMNK